MTECRGQLGHVSALLSKVPLKMSQLPTFEHFGRTCMSKGSGATAEQRCKRLLRVLCACCVRACVR